MTEPFDRSLPSPIGAVLAMRSSAAESVVIAGQLSEVCRHGDPSSTDEALAHAKDDAFT